MTFRLTKFALAAALSCFIATPSTAQEDTTETAPPDVTMTEKFESWSQQPFAFSAMVSNSRRSSPDFQFKIDNVRFRALFDAGRKKRNATLDCLELADECEIKGTAYMLFSEGRLQLNVTDINWLAVPAIDFDEKASRLHYCFRSATRDQKKFSSVVEAKLTVEDLERKQTTTLEPITPREISRGFEMLETAVTKCAGSRFRLPLGEYRIKVFTQSGDTFMDYYEEKG